MYSKPRSYKVGAFTLCERDLVEMIQRQIIEQGVSRKGTYNTADPTDYHNATAWVHFNHDPLFKLAPEGEYHDPECDMPGEAIYRLHANDCTWGIDFDVYEWDEESNSSGPMIYSAYWTHEPSMGNKRWHPRDGKKNAEELCAFLLRAMTDGTWANKPEKLYTPDDVMGDHMGMNV